MTIEELNRANSLKNKLDAVNNLLEGLDKDNTLTIACGLYTPMRYSAEINDTTDSIQKLESICYNRIKDILKEYKARLDIEFNNL